MQALFSFINSALSANATVLIETDGPRPALVGAVAILHLSVAAGDGIGRSKSAFDIGAGHSRENLLPHHGIAFGAAGEVVAAAIVLHPYNSELCSRALACTSLSWPGQRDYAVGARRRIRHVLVKRCVIWRAPLSGEADVAGFVSAAIDACGECRSCGEQQGAAARNE